MIASMSWSLSRKESNDDQGGRTHVDVARRVRRRRERRVDEVFDWYFSGDVEVATTSETMGMTFHVSQPSAEHLRSLQAEVGAMLTGRRTFEVADGSGGRHPWDVPAFIVTHQVPDGWPRHGSRVQFVTDGIESAVARARSAAGPKSVGVHGADTIQQCLNAGLDLSPALPPAAAIVELMYRRHR